MWKNMVQLDRLQVTKECGLENMRFSCRVTEARIQIHTRNIQYLFLHNLLIPSDFVKCFTATQNLKFAQRLFCH
jgi:hypothetical protein